MTHAARWGFNNPSQHPLHSKDYSVDATSPALEIAKPLHMWAHPEKALEQKQLVSYSPWGVSVNFSSSDRMDEHLFEAKQILEYFSQNTTTTHWGMLSVCVCVDFVETWNGCGFPQGTPSILWILKLPWLLCVWKLLLNGDCFSLFAMNAHIYAA